MAEHTEKYKKAVESCKAKKQKGVNCFAVIKDVFKEKGWAVYVKGTIKKKKVEHEKPERIKLLARLTVGLQKDE